MKEMKNALRAHVKETVLAILLLVTSFLLPACGSTEPERTLETRWDEKPVITHVYEKETGVIVLKWQGNSNFYRVYADNEKVADVKLPSIAIELKPGNHQLTIVPIKAEAKNASTNVDISLGDIGVNVDLAALGVDPKDILQGEASEGLNFHYVESPLPKATPEIIGVATDSEDRVLLTFLDKYSSDIYRVSIKDGKDVNSVLFDVSKEEAARFVTKENTRVTIALDQHYLQEHGCLVPELEKEYSFSVQLQKRPENYIDKSKIDGVFLVSKESKRFTYTPHAAWKQAPQITYASQSADGEVTLRWEHEDFGRGCEYKVIKQNKVLMVKKGEEEIGRTLEKQFVVSDLMNGKYSFFVVPVRSGEEGFASETAALEVKNNWVAAPDFSCEPGKDQTVILKWKAADGVNSYHVAVSVGSGSLLKYIKMDFNKYTEFNVTAQPGIMEYQYKYDKTVDPEAGVRLKFEMYGIRRTRNGEEQQSATSTQTIEIR